MSWHGIEGHDAVVEQFRRAAARGRLASTFLFVGPPGIGKRSLAVKLAQALLCERYNPQALEPCGQCHACELIAAGNHPDLDIVSKPVDKSTIPLELLIGQGDKRLHEGLCHRLSLKPYQGSRKIAIIDDADALNVEGANCLLKTLEEPPPGSVLILIGTSTDKQLPTIRSRCQIVRFAPLAEELVARLLVANELVADAAQAQRLAAHSGGSLQQALDLADEGLWTFRQHFLERLANPPLDVVRVAKAVNTFVEEAGKEAPPRRRRARHALALAGEFYRQLARGLCGAETGADPEVQAAVEQARGRWTGDAAVAVRCTERCMDAARQVDGNAYLPVLIDAWIDDLGRLAQQT